MICEIHKNDLVPLSRIITESILYSVIPTESEAFGLINEVVESLKKWFDSKGHGFSAKYCINRSIAGFIIVKGFWNLSHLFVLPSFQRRGIGKALVLNALETCKCKSPQGIIRLNASTSASNFYSHLGFIQADKEINLPGGCVPFEYRF